MWRSDEPAYDLTTRGGRATITRQFARGGGPILNRRPTMTVALTYANEYEDYTVSDEALADPDFRDDLIALGLNPETGAGKGHRSALIVDASRNKTDNIVDAKRGYLAALHLEKAGTFLGGTYDYYELTGEGRYYLNIANKAIIAAQGRAGSIAADGDPDVLVPFSKNYFLGGATTLRGWGTVRGLAADRRRSADRRHDLHEFLGRTPCPDLELARRRHFSRWRQRVG